MCSSIRPNIILMTSHDIGRRLCCYGHSEVSSPALDQLAADGAIFRNTFCTQSICSPSRASIYTGRYPHSNGVMGLVHGQFQWDLHHDEVHLAQILKRSGYQTARAGLQHETCRPEHMGFDHIDGGVERWAEPVADVCESFLNRFASQPDKPFYLQVGFFEGHRVPGHPNHEFGPMDAGDIDMVQVPDYLIDEPGTRAELAQLHGSIRSMDGAVGRIMAAVDAHGYRDNTIVIFMTDHGIPFPRAKTTCYDPGLEVAFLMQGPDIPARTEVGDLVSNVDLLPTLMDFIGLPCPENVQGRSLAGLFGTRPYEERSYIFGEQTYLTTCDPIRCVRSRNHKLIVNFLPVAAIPNCTQQWSPVSKPAFPPNAKGAIHPLAELYDLVTDPLEEDNLIDEPSKVSVKEKLLRALQVHMRDTADPLCQGLPVPRRFQEALDLIGLNA